METLRLKNSIINTYIRLTYANRLIKIGNVYHHNTMHNKEPGNFDELFRLARAQKPIFKVV